MDFAEQKYCAVGCSASFSIRPKWKNNMSCYNDVTESLTTSFTSSTMD